MNYDEWKPTEPHWDDDAPEYVPCAMAGCPMVVQAREGDDLCEMCETTVARAKLVRLPTQYLMMSHCDNPDHLIRRIRRRL